MRKLLLFVLLSVTGALAAQITIDGTYQAVTEPSYQTLATFSDQTQTGFGPYGILGLYAAWDLDHLYVNIQGVPEGNFNRIFFYIDVVRTTTGINSGSAVPVDIGFGNMASAVLDVPNADFGFSFSYGTGGGITQGFLNGSSYVSGTNTDYFYGSVPVDGTPTTIGGGTNFDGSRFAFTNAPDFAGSNGTEALELELDLASLGITAGTDVHLFAAYASADGSFWSANSLPEVPGLMGNNIGGSPDFTAQPGVQFATLSVALPVSYLGFTATPNGKTVRLDWQTGTEESNRGFAVERSRNGTEFTDIGWIGGRGNSTETQTYAFTDAAPLGGTNYYRLRQTDFDGTTHLSPVVTAELTEAATALLVSPNPAAAGSNPLVRYRAENDGRAQVWVTDLNGRTLSRHDQPVLAGWNDLPLLLDALPAGVYVVRVADGGEAVLTERLFVR